MRYWIAELAIYPFSIDKDRKYVNVHEASDEELDVLGWAISVIFEDGEGKEEPIVETFPFYPSALNSAKRLAAKYGVDIDHRY